MALLEVLGFLFLVMAFGFMTRAYVVLLMSPVLMPIIVAKGFAWWTPLCRAASRSPGAWGRASWSTTARRELLEAQVFFLLVIVTVSVIGLVQSFAIVVEVPMFREVLADGIVKLLSLVAAPSAPVGSAAR